jgi:aryl-alcohol dehydrogenase-like predicted oxidoreductase
VTEYIGVSMDVTERKRDEAALQLAQAELGRVACRSAARACSVPYAARKSPDWARGFAGSWGQFFLKYLVADPRVTAVIPGTADPAHMTDNAGAMRDPLPDPDQRRQMVAFAEAL